MTTTEITVLQRGSPVATIITAVCKDKLCGARIWPPSAMKAHRARMHTEGVMPKFERRIVRPGAKLPKRQWPHTNYLSQNSRNLKRKGD